jgi:hypothetical protein
MTEQVLTEPVSIDHEYKLHEYDRLCSELEKQLERRDHIDDRVLQVAAFCATGAGIAATIGGIVNNLLIQVVGAAISLCACPILLAFLACQREQCDLRIGQIQWQLRYRHEQRYLIGEGWDDTRHDVFGKRPWFPRLVALLSPHRGSPTYHELAARRGLSLIGSLGMFVTIQALYVLGAVLCAVLAVEHYPPMAASIFLCVMLAAALIGVALTCIVMQHKRQRKSSSISTEKGGDDAPNVEERF